MVMALISRGVLCCLSVEMSKLAFLTFWYRAMSIQYDPVLEGLS